MLGLTWSKSPLHLFTLKIENSLGWVVKLEWQRCYSSSPRVSPPCILDCTLARDKAGNWIHIVSARESRERTPPLLRLAHGGQCDGDIVLTLPIRGHSGNYSVGCQAETHILPRGKAHTQLQRTKPGSLSHTHRLKHMRIHTLSLFFKNAFSLIAQPCSHWFYGPIVALQGWERGEKLLATAELSHWVRVTDTKGLWPLLH